MKDNRLHLKLTPEIDAKLREIAKITGLKLVRIVSNGIELEYTRCKNNQSKSV